MHLNRELLQSRSNTFESFRTNRALKSQPRVPQITIRGDNNLINVGSSGIVKVKATEVADSAAQTARNGQWPQQILDAIRLKAAKTRRSNEQICELAGRVLGRAVLNIEKLSARELARVYEALCAGDSKF